MFFEWIFLAEEDGTDGTVTFSDEILAATETTSANIRKDLSQWQERHATLVLSKVKVLISFFCYFLLLFLAICVELWIPYALFGLRELGRKEKKFNSLNSPVWTTNKREKRGENKRNDIFQSLEMNRKYFPPIWWEMMGNGKMVRLFVWKFFKGYLFKIVKVQ